jgi:hypothetical protein
VKILLKTCTFQSLLIKRLGQNAGSVPQFLNQCSHEKHFIYLYRHRSEFELYREGEEILEVTIFSSHEFWSYSVCLSVIAVHTDL